MFLFVLTRRFCSVSMWRFLKLQTWN